MRFPDASARTPFTTSSRICIVVLVVVYLLGCMSAQIAPADAIARIRKIAVVPIRLPITVTPALMQAFETNAGTGSLPPSSGVGVLATIVLVFVLSVEWPKQEDRRNRALELLAEWAASKDPWNPEQAIAQDAAALLRRSSAYEDIWVNQAVVLPGVKTTEPTWHMENWMKPRRAWYQRTDSLVNVSEPNVLDADAILEIAAGPVELSREHVVLHVAVKLISTSTNEVLGRSNCVGYTNAAPLEDILQNEGRRFKSLYGELSGRILDKCLREAGLIR
jgi:hypothetical protein